MFRDERFPLAERTHGEVDVVDDALIIKPCSEPARTLEELLSTVTTENMHEEIDAGQPVGREAW
jgi:antitoxin MazE